MNTNTILGVVLIAGAAALGATLMTEVEDNTVYYYSVSEAQSAEVRAQPSVRMSGNVVTGTVDRIPEQQFVSFAITDSLGVTAMVSYTGPIPDIFRDGVEVVVEGRFENGVFEASNLLAKCPSKYEKTGEREDFRDVEVPPEWVPN